MKPVRTASSSTPDSASTSAKAAETAANPPTRRQDSAPPPGARCERETEQQRRECAGSDGLLRGEGEAGHRSGEERTSGSTGFNEPRREQHADEQQEHGERRVERVALWRCDDHERHQRERRDGPASRHTARVGDHHERGARPGERDQDLDDRDVGPEQRHGRRRDVHGQGQRRIEDVAVEVVAVGDALRDQQEPALVAGADASSGREVERDRAERHDGACAPRQGHGRPSGARATNTWNGSAARQSRTRSSRRSAAAPTGVFAANGGRNPKRLTP